MSVVLQVSDTHFGTEQPVVVEALLRLVRAQRSDLVGLSGDITHFMMAAASRVAVPRRATGGRFPRAARPG